MKTHKRVFGVLAGVALVAVLPGIASADTTEAIADTGGMTLMIPGVPVTVVVTLDDFGSISTVEISDTTFDPTKEEPGKMRFVRDNGADGSTVIDIKAKGSKLSAKLKTTNLDDILGANVWTGDIFGTGEATTVTFNVAQASDNGFSYAEITSVAVDSPFANTVEGPHAETDDDDGEVERKSKAHIEFASDGFTKTLKIEVKTEIDDDEGGVEFKLKVELKGKDQRELFGEDALGTHTWQGLLCDGTDASVTYTVSEVGITIDDLVVAEGATFDIKASGPGFKVKVNFTDTEGNHRAYFKASLHDKDDKDGVLDLKVKSKTTTSCKPDKKNDDDPDKKNDDDHDKKDKKNDDD